MLGKQSTFPLHGGVAVITGAASGIGAATALVLAQHGCHLALVDRNAELLATTAHVVRSQGVRVSQHVLDVTNHVGVAALPEQVLAAHGNVSILINNAGASMIGMVEQTSFDEFHSLIELNLMSMVSMTKAFLPVLRQQPHAHIVNVSSMLGLIATIGQSAYAASKFGVRGFSESLRHELEGSTVSVTVVHPGGVKTDILRNTRVAARAGSVEPQILADTLRTTADRAAKLMVRAIEQRTQRLLIGSDAHMIDTLQRLMPVQYWRVLKLLFGKQIAMGNSKK